MSEANRLWVRKVKGQRVIDSGTEPCDTEDPQAALLEICRRMDVPRPIWLGKHQREYDQFLRTHFTQEHFVEPINFTRLEIELIQPEDQKKSRPRIPLMDA